MAPTLIALARLFIVLLAFAGTAILATLAGPEINKLMDVHATERTSKQSPLVTPLPQKDATQQISDKKFSESLENLNNTIEKLNEVIGKHKEGEKDAWDKFDLVTKFVASVLLIAIGGTFTFLYNSKQSKKDSTLKDQQQRVFELDTIAKFMPYITSEEEDKRQTAFLLIQQLIGTEIATTLAVLKLTPETPDTLKKLGDRNEGEDRQIADAVLDRVVRSPEFNIVSAFYVTDRKVLDASYLKFGGEVGEVSYGVAEVSIPSRHRLGALERPSLLRLELKEDQSKHVVLLHASSYNLAGFLAAIGQQLGEPAANEILVFVHGFNVSFEDAVKRLAQLNWDLNFRGVTILYSWPSAGSLKDYFRDETTSVWTVSDLVAFLQKIPRIKGETKIHLLADGLGSRPVVQALDEIGATLNTSIPRIVDQLIFVGPDINADMFINKAPVLINLANRITVYASSQDLSLAASAQIHSFPRAGQSAEHLAPLKGIDIVDVSDVDASLVGHSYYGRTVHVLADMNAVLNGVPATKRPGLRMVGSKGENYWKLG